MTQAERIARQEILRTVIARLEATLADFRLEMQRLMADCDHTYPDGRNAGAGGRTRICAICGQMLRNRDEKLWG